MSSILIDNSSLLLIAVKLIKPSGFEYLILLLIRFEKTVLKDSLSVLRKIAKDYEIHAFKGKADGVANIHTSILYKNEKDIGQ